MHGAIRTLDLISAQRCPADSTATGSHLTSHCFCFPFFATFQTKLLLPFGLCFSLCFGAQFIRAPRPFGTLLHYCNKPRQTGSKKLGAPRTHVLQTAEPGKALMVKLLNNLFKAQMENRNFHNHKLYKTIHTTHCIEKIYWLYYFNDDLEKQMFQSPPNILLPLLCIYTQL